MLSNDQNLSIECNFCPLNLQTLELSVMEWPCLFAYHLMGASPSISPEGVWYNLTQHDGHVFDHSIYITYEECAIFSHKNVTAHDVCEINFVVSCILMYNTWCLLWHTLH
jgi:hypothetical protein